MNPIYSAWNKCGAESRYEFLKQLYSNYDGMLEQAIKDMKQEKRRLKHETLGYDLFGISSIFRNVRKRWFK